MKLVDGKDCVQIGTPSLLSKTHSEYANRDLPAKRDAVALKKESFNRVKKAFHIFHAAGFVMNRIVPAMKSPQPFVHGR